MVRHWINFLLTNIFKFAVFVGALLTCENTYAETPFDASVEASKCINLSLEKRYNSAIPFCQKACSIHDGVGCYYLGMMYSFGYGVIQNFKYAVPYYEKACSSEYYTYSTSPIYRGASDFYRSQGCLALGVIYDDVRDNLKAKNYYLESCNLNNQKGCFRLAAFYNKNKDYKNSGKYYKKSCELKHPDGCLSLSILYINPDGNSHDFIKGKEYAGKACDLGSKEGCNVYRELNEKGY